MSTATADSSHRVIDPVGDFAECDKLIARCMKSEDYIEGRRAFMEKREPRFKGR